MERSQAVALMEQHLGSENLRNHSLASEAIMRALARRLGQNENQWGLAGLLHDLDYDQTKDEPAGHGLKTAEWLRDLGVDEEIVKAILAHNAEALGLSRVTAFDLALTAAETMTGMIVATALVYPDKKIRSVKPKSILKRMKEKQFAKGANRDMIMLCEDIGIPLSEFAAISLEAMSQIDKEIGL